MRLFSCHWPRVLVHFLLLGLLTGCSILPPQDTTSGISLSDDERAAAWQQHLNHASQIKGWLTNGKIAFRAPNDSATLSFRWVRDQDHFHMQLTGPLGQGGAVIWKTNDRVTLKTSDKTTHASDADGLIHTQLGWPFPVTALRHWVRGIPSPHTQSFKYFGSNGLLEKLSQDGWLIHYLRYSTINNVQLPEKIRLQHGDLRVTIIVKEWQLNPSINWSDYKLDE